MDQWINVIHQARELHDEESNLLIVSLKPGMAGVKQPDVGKGARSTWPGSVSVEISSSRAWLWPAGQLCCLYGDLLFSKPRQSSHLAR
jgi:hypothetical protein